MKDALLPIYRAVSEGRLSQAEALVRIRALKQAADTGLLLATREWSAAPLAATASRGQTSAPLATLLFDLPAPAVAALRALPRVDVRLERSLHALAPALAFGEVVLAVLEAIKSQRADRSQPSTPRPRLLLIVGDGSAEAASEPLAAGLEGLLRTALEEDPALSARLLQVPGDITPAELRELVEGEAAVADGGPRVRWQRVDGLLQRQCARWQIVAEADPPHDAPAVYKEGGCYLITGGAGGIGRQFAGEIVRRTAQARIVLLGRSAADADLERALQAIATPRHRLEYLAIDVLEVDALSTLLARLRTEGDPLTGVIHCAGVTRDGFIRHKSAEDVRRVLAPKVAGLVALDQAIADAPLDFMLLCSSVAACWGNVGQADYAAANGFMDGFAALRNRWRRAGRRHGLTLSVNWPLWAAGGMCLDDDTRSRLQARTGMQPLGSADAMRAVGEGLRNGVDQWLVMAGERPAMRAFLHGEPAATTAAAPSPPGALAASIAGDAPMPAVDAADPEFRARALAYLRQQFAAVLKVPLARLRADTPFEHYGMDSILAMKLVTHFEAIFGKLPKTLAFEYQTIAQLADYFCTSHGARLLALLAPATPTAATPAAAAAPRMPPPRPRARIAAGAAAQPATTATTVTTASSAAPKPSAVGNEHEPIAVIGLSGRYPGARDLEAFWDNLATGRDCIGEVPPERWRWQAYYVENAGQALPAGRHSSKWGGFIDGADEFDPRFFNIAPRDAEQIDPQERLFLEHAWQAVEDAGYSRSALQTPRGGQVGVYAGVMYGEYNRSGSLASIANRVSYVLNLHGPSMTLDSMCSSSLTAIHLACQDLKLGRTDMALAGGVNLSLHPGKYSMLSAGQFISSDGHCASFGEGGDGYIPGEGVGVVLLKRLSDAERDGDAIHAVIRGSALNHGGKTNGYTVPNPQAQAAVIADALVDAGVHPREVSYLEAHGTGTKLGDPIEIAALGRAFGAQTADTGFCLIGSAKSNIGHCESAAGVAGLTKVILQLRHRQIVPSLHSERLNPNIDFERTPFVVNQQLRAWDAPAVDGRVLPRIAGLSSFGAGGSNAHVVIEEYCAAAVPAAAAEPPCLVLLSARSFAQLQQRAAALRAFVERKPALDLQALTWTLQVGREPMDERLALRVQSRAELLAKLGAFIDASDSADGALGEDLFYASARRHRDAIALFDADAELKASVDAWFRAGKFGRLLELWSRGLDLDWRRLHGATPPRRLHLPGYPFARERYWREEAVEPQAASPVLHALLHRNASTPGRQRYLSSFGAGDPRIAGPSATGEPRLSAGLLLEAARAALTDALSLSENVAFCELRFAAPLVVRSGLALDIAVFAPGQGARPSTAQAGFEILGAASDRGPSPDDECEQVLCQGLLAAAAADEPRIIDCAANAQAATPLFADPATFADACRARGLAGAPATIAALARLRDGLWLSVDATPAARSAVADATPLAALLDAALLAAHWLRPAADAACWPASIAALRLQGSCVAARHAWVRPCAAAASGDAIAADISICDADGRVCIELEAVQLRPTTAMLPVAAPPAAAIATRSAPPAALADRWFHAGQAPLAHALSNRLSRAAASAKPSAIRLSIATLDPLPAQPTRGKPALVLPPLDAVGAASTASVCLRDRGDGVIALQLQLADGALDPALIEALQQALAHAATLPTLKLLVLEGQPAVFLRGAPALLDDGPGRALWQALSSFPFPTIAVLAGEAMGAGLWLACGCDFILAAEDARCAFGLPDAAAAVSPAQVDWLVARVGSALAPLLLAQPQPMSAAQLGALGWGATVVPAATLDPAVRALCERLADKPREALRLLKQQLATALGAQAAAPGPVAPTPAAQPSAPRRPHEAIALVRDADGQAELRITDRQVAADELLRQLVHALDEVGAVAALRISSARADFLPPETARHPALLREAVLAIARIDAPVLTVLEHDARNAGFLLALAGDLVVLAEEGRYGAIALQDHRAQPALVEALLERLVGPAAREWALVGTELSGRELQQRHRFLQVVPATEVARRAAELALALGRLPRGLFRQKAALAATIAATIEGAAVDAAVEPALDDAAPGPLALDSAVVRAELDADGVLLVRLEDRDARNMFSDALIGGLQEVFERAARLRRCKALVLVGHGGYFASGGTRDGLKAIQQGRVRFTDHAVFDLPLRCPLPVVAAMQGHGIGAGWTLGLFADCTLFAAESRYLSPYMSLGFTPGAGATGVLPAKLGIELARESLFTARELGGDELGRRNPSLRVLPREQVLPAALTLAQAFCRHSRAELVAWKRACNEPRAAAWRALLEREVAMHEATLVGQADALARIEQRFEPGIARQALPSALAGAARAPLQGDVLPTIRRLLAEELHLAESEIDPLTPFVELGLDSISGVTWVRRINAHFGLAIEATKVYSHPNLQALGRHVGELARAAAPVAELPAPAASSAPPVAARPARVELGVIRERIRALLARELRLDADAIEADRGFVELGLDSISGVTWVRAINDSFGTSIEATKVYTYPTLDSFARHLRECIEHASTAVAEVPEARSAAPMTDAATSVTTAWPPLASWRSATAASMPVTAAPITAVAASALHAPEIAVIGMAGRFPMAKDVEVFWDNIASGRNCISEVPASRFDLAASYVEGRAALGETNSKWMGVLEGHDQFDPLFFGLSPIEAESMDPQQRLFLQCCWHGMENAGYTAERLSGSRCGVFVGCANSDYNLLTRAQQINALGFTGGAISILAARVSYFLNLQGPCVSMDTACSSSLVAIATACDSLLTGSSDLAFAGGVYVMANADMFLKTSSAGMLSPDGRCYTFDQRANGFVPGEGVGVVLLKRLADAERDGDAILGVIRGWGVNQDGRTNGITAPNADSQQRLIRDVHRRFGIDAAGIQLVEAHGTGTKLGDPIEVEGLKTAFGSGVARRACALGSVKTNIGHCLTAAGVSGVIKLLLALRHRQLPPSINFETPNEHLALDDSPFFVNTDLQDWTPPPGQPRQAAISSFGFSGTNAHLVLAEYAASPATIEATPEAPAGCVIPLSARTREELLQKARDLRRFVVERPALTLAALAGSLQLHRDAMDERLAFVAWRLEDVLDRLDAFVAAGEASRPAPPGLHVAHVRQGAESVRLLVEDDAMRELVVDRCIADGALDKLCALWVKGLAVDWRRLQPAARPPVLPLPPYPFSESSYWVTPDTSVLVAAAGAPSALPRHAHPLLQQKVADLREQGYRQPAAIEQAPAERATVIPRMHLPTYAFARLRCWVPPADAQRGAPPRRAAPPPSAAPERLHTLDSIAELLTELEQDRLSADQVVERVKQLA